MSCSVLEEKSRLNAIARHIMFDPEQYYSHSSNPEFEKRRKQILDSYEKELERAFRRCGIEDWETMQKDDYNMRAVISDALMYRDDLDTLIFEMGFRCAFILWQDITNTTDRLTDGPASEPGPFSSETEPPTIEEILQKDPDTLTMEEVGIMAEATDIPKVSEYYYKIPNEKREEWRSIERNSKWYDIIWKDGEITTVKERAIPDPEYKNLSPEKQRRYKIKQNYWSFHRDQMRQWCREHGIKYISSED